MRGFSATPRQALLLTGCCDLAALILLRSANFQAYLNWLSLKRKIKSLLNGSFGTCYAW